MTEWSTMSPLGSEITKGKVNTKFYYDHLNNLKGHENINDSNCNVIQPNYSQISYVKNCSLKKRAIATMKVKSDL